MSVTIRPLVSFNVIVALDFFIIIMKTHLVLSPYHLEYEALLLLSLECKMPFGNNDKFA